MTISEPTYSIVIPALDEQDSLKELYVRICTAMKSLEGDFEILFIDDGSTDNTFNIMKELHEQDNRVKVFRFGKNQGKAPALETGFEKARGKYVITMDADLQDDPDEIIHLVQKIDEGYDLVSGWKKKRFDPPSKLIFSRIFNAVVSRATGIKLHDFNCGLKCYRQEVVKSVRLYGEMHRFIPALAWRLGWRITEIPVTHHPRKTGKSKYGSERIIRGLLDFVTVIFITQYMQSPLYLFGRWGFTLIFFSVCIFLAGLMLSIFEAIYIGVAALILSFIFGIMGVQCILFGLLAEMLTFNHNKNIVPNYVHEELT